MPAEQICAMPDEELRVKVAELCGWKLVRGTVTSVGKLREHDDGPSESWRHPDGTSYYENWISHLPNYTRDLNAMHEAETRLDNEKWACYMAWLVRIFDTRAASAPARQRAEAFVLTMEES